MSASLCIKCEAIVGGYEKYCDDCVKKYRVAQDANWHKIHEFEHWQADRRTEFEKDILLIPPRITNFSRLEPKQPATVATKKTSRHRRKRTK